MPLLTDEFIGIDALKLSPGETMRAVFISDSNSFKTGNMSTGDISIRSTDENIVIDHRPANATTTMISLDEFLPGSSAKISGLNTQDFTLSYSDTSAGGLLITAIPDPGMAGARTTITIRGYNTADLSNGRLSTTFESDPRGTSYLLIHAS